EENKASESFNLVHGLLISYTKFFRDPDVWVEVARSVVPRLLDGHIEASPRESDMFKIWSVGCATGEEAYTLALIVAEVCRIREISPKRIKIFATDISEKNIVKAQEGKYKLEALEDIPAEYHSYIKKDKEAGTFSFAQEIKDLITFSVHDILVMAPLSKISLISCRNLLIYIRSLYQQSVFENLSFGLKKGGRLILGQAERTTDDSLFKADYEKIHLYESLGTKRRFGFTTQRSLPPTVGQAAAFGGSLEGKQIGGGLGTSQPPNTGPAMASALEHVIKRGVLLRSDGLVIRFLGDCRDYFSFPKTGPSFQIEQLAIPELMPYLTASLASCLKMRKTVSIGKHQVELANGETSEVYMTMEPFDSIDDVDTTYVLLRIFEDEGEGEGESVGVKSFGGSSGDVIADRELVEGLQEELSATKKNLAEALEHHVVTGEELQVTNEELMSSNEELMASNEELKSLNEELQVINQNHTFNQENILKRFALYNEVLDIKGSFYFILDTDLILKDAYDGFLKASGLSERDFVWFLQDFNFFTSHFVYELVSLKEESLSLDSFNKLNKEVNLDGAIYKVGVFSQSESSKKEALKTDKESVIRWVALFNKN
ncbi:MAG: CheR family methyltransferase, partial [Bdellovibrionota bacterium]|nr:CheR family methyltransferase [Bdellovibrionota bacterium]